MTGGSPDHSTTACPSGGRTAGRENRKRFLRGYQAVVGCSDLEVACKAIEQGNFYQTLDSLNEKDGVIMWRKEFNDILEFAIKNRRWKTLKILMLLPVATLMDIEGDPQYLKNYKFRVRSRYGMRVLCSLLFKSQLDNLIIKTEAVITQSETRDQDAVRPQVPILALPRPPVAPAAPPIS